MSGTLFDEPVIERILGYYIIIDDPNFPRTLPGATNFVRSIQFKGINENLVLRTNNEAFISPKLNEIIITHTLSEQEKQVYLTLKLVMISISDSVKKYKSRGDTDNVRKFNSYLLAILIYTRQCIVCPIIPLANVAIDLSYLKKKNELAEILDIELEKNQLKEYLNDISNIKSSRMKSALATIEKHPDEKVVVFTCFRTCLDIFKHFLPDDRPNFTLVSTMNTILRQKELDKFKESKDGILVLTYELGAEGLNLQFSHTVLLLDFWWNSGKTQQAIARVLRYGQMSSHVNVYFFTSNTGLENVIFKKQKDKLTVLDEIKNGPMKSKIAKIKIQDIIRFIQQQENIILLKDINSHAM